MRDGTKPTRAGDPTNGWVEIRVQGHLEPRWSEWLDGLTLARNGDGTTVIEGTVVDQAALFGVIDRLRDMAVPLISVTHAGTSTPTPHPTGRTAPTTPRSSTTSSRPRSQS